MVTVLSPSATAMIVASVVSSRKSAHCWANFAARPRSSRREIDKAQVARARQPQELGFNVRAGIPLKQVTCLGDDGCGNQMRRRGGSKCSDAPRVMRVPVVAPAISGPVSTRITGALETPRRIYSDCSAGSVGPSKLPK